MLPLQHGGELEHDDQDIAQIHKAIVIVQGVLGSNAKHADRRSGMTPAQMLAARRLAELAADDYAEARHGV